MYVGLDLGTSVLKGIVMDNDGTIIASSSKEVPLVTPQPDWAEQSPEMWWSLTQDVLHYLCSQVDASKIQGIGISGQMHGLVAYNKSNEAVRRAIIWMDKRSSQEIEYILDTVGREQLYSQTGNPVFTGFLLASLLWLQRNEKELYSNIATVSSPKDYIAYKLCGTLRSEPTDALATAAFDYASGTWSEEILKAINLDPAIFPKIHPTFEPYGGVRDVVAKRIGLPAGIPIYGASDQAMAAMGLGLIENGQSTLALSTGGQFLVIGEHGIIDPHRRLHTLNHVLPNIGLYMAATLSAGFSLKWFKNSVLQRKEQSYPELMQGVGNIPIGSNGLFFLPFLAGERTPFFNPNLRGAFIGLAHSHSTEHMVRAIIEGVAFSMRHCLEVFDDLALLPKRIILGGGGAKNAVWRQVMSDTLNRPLETITVEDHSPFGAAIVAKFAPDNFAGLEEFYTKVIQPAEFIHPNENSASSYNALFAEYKEIAQKMNEQYQK